MTGELKISEDRKVIAEIDGQFFCEDPDDYEETSEETHCPRCGKDYYEWGDLGCSHCDVRVREGL